MIRKILQILELIEHNQRRIIEKQEDIENQLVFMYQEWYEGRTKKQEEINWFDKFNN